MITINVQGVPDFSTIRRRFPGPRVIFREIHTISHKVDVRLIRREFKFLSTRGEMKTHEYPVDVSLEEFVSK